MCKGRHQWRLEHRRLRPFRAEKKKGSRNRETGKEKRDRVI